MPLVTKTLSPAELAKLEHAFATDPGSEAYKPLAEAYLGMGRFMEAMVVCKKGVKAHPSVPDPRVLLARVYAEQGKDKKAVEELTFALQVSPTDKVALRMMGSLQIKGGENPYKIHQELQEAMQNDCMIAKTEEGLSRCLATIHGLQKRAEKLSVPGDVCYNPGWHAARDLRFMLRTSEIITLCALQRQESRGAQWRLDYPAKDDAYWGKINLIATKDGDSVKIERRSLPEMPAELKALFEEVK